MVRLNEISSRAAKLSVRMQRKVKGQEKGQGDGKMMGSIDSSKSGEDNEVRSTSICGALPRLLIQHQVKLCLQRQLPPEFTGDKRVT